MNEMIATRLTQHLQIAVEFNRCFLLKLLLVSPVGTSGIDFGKVRYLLSTADECHQIAFKSFPYALRCKPISVSSQEAHA